MKPILPFLAGVAVIAATVPFFTQPSQAQQPAGHPADKMPAYPVGTRCVVTLNPADAAKTREGQTNGDVYRVADNKVQGEFLAINADWLVLKEGNYENWIPRDKVLSMRVSR